MREEEGLTTKTIKKYAIGILAAIALIWLLFHIGKMYENVEAGEIVVIQDPVDGELHVYKQPGLYYQNFGKATHYKKSYQYWFSKTKEDGDSVDHSIKVRFNDGGHANLGGSVRIDMPSDDAQIISLHTKYGSQDAIENNLIGQTIQKAVYMTGPMMSSAESYAAKRNDLISYVEDQAINGVYKTIVVGARIKDPIDTAVEKTISIVQIKLGDHGEPMRQEVSPILSVGIKLYNLSINSIDYDPIVEAQIATQQKATMSVQTAIATAKKAEQDAFTVEQQGKANAATAKWDQEAIKAKLVTEAEQKRDVAKLEADAEEQNKRANILKGQGEAEYKKLVTQANNNVELRLKAWTEVNLAYAAAMANSWWVPQFQTGAAGSQGAPNELINLMMSNTAKQLSLDMYNTQPASPNAYPKKK